MLFLVTGASGSGKTACLEKLRGLTLDIAWFDFDDVGVPDDADKIWRQRTAEYWVQKAIDLQSKGQSMGLNGNVTYGEILACPSSIKINRIEACLLDCHDVTRVDRLRRRGTYGATQDMLCWAAWQRMHAVDPQWRRDVIKDGGAPEMVWQRWEDWQRGDERWQVRVIDTTKLTIDQVAVEVASWIRERQTATV